jgi:K+-transporting ATPase c subunit
LTDLARSSCPAADELDRDITPATAKFPAPRIAAVHHLPLSQVMSLIDEHTSGRTSGSSACRG